MLNQLFPERLDNAFRGQMLAIWLLIPIVAIKVLMGLNVSGLNPWIDPRTVAVRADGIPLAELGAEASGHILFLFSSWGLALLSLSLLALAALVRYRTMIPLMYVLLTIEQFGRWVLSNAHLTRISEAHDGLSPGAIFNWGLSAALLAGLVMSFVPRRHSRKPLLAT